MTLVNGRTLAIPYPKKGFNCNPAWALTQTKRLPESLPWCPAESDRQTLNDGRTPAVVYPNPGFNCKNTDYPKEPLKI